MGKGNKKTPKTAAPSGCDITRNGNKFTLSWKIKAKDVKDGQKVRYKANSGKWTTKSLGKKNKQSFTVTYTRESLNSVAIQVQDNQDKKVDKKDPTASKWVGDTFKFNTPPASIANMYLSESVWNASIVSWGHKGNSFTNTDKIGFLRTYYQTTFHAQDQADAWAWEYVVQQGVTNKNFNDLRANLYTKSGNSYKSAAKAKFVSGTTYYKIKTLGESGSFTKTEDTETLSSGKAYVRKFRFYIKGRAGNNSWVTCSHYYSTPYVPVISKATISENKEGGTNCYLKWVADTDEFHPIDSVTVQYGIAVPGVGMSCPSSISWTDRPTASDTGSYDADNFSLDAQIGVDECLFVRVNVVHDNNVSRSSPKLATGVVTMLATPSSFSVDPNFSTFRVAVNIVNESEVPDSRIAIVYHSVKDGTPTDQIIGIIDRTSSMPVTIQCPNWNLVDEWSLGAYAFVGDTMYSQISYDVGSVTYTYNVYEIPDPKMKSQYLWAGGDVPKAPTEVEVDSPKEGLAVVTWDWAWESADIAELSWSDHEDAWESTDQPETYRIPNTFASKWSIYGLESGVTWFIRVRLIKTTDGGENPGPWSAIKPLDMTSAPNVPIIELSKKSVVHDEAVTVSWKYDSTDGTDQKDAKIISVTETSSGVYEYGDEIDVGTIGTNRSVDIIPDNVGWNNGEKHGIALKVISESDQHSGYSTPEFIAVAEPLTCSIVETSFKKRYSYALASDLVVDENKTYYTVSATVVATPDVNDLKTYYELVDNVYSSSSDADIDPEKTYYTVEGTVVGSPQEEYIDTYYLREDINYLDVMPIEVEAAVSGGIDDSYQATVSIDRASSYFIDRPDESNIYGFEGENVYSNNVNEVSAILIEQKDLINSYLDDTARYTLTVRVYDDLGQEAEAKIDFKVEWEHQASIPDATIEFDYNYSAVKITPSISPAKFAEGDTFDIYRLSIEKPVLIVKGGTYSVIPVESPSGNPNEQGYCEKVEDIYVVSEDTEVVPDKTYYIGSGQTWVDPYPTIGEFGGHRVVTVTANGDFISNEKESNMAWTDFDAEDGDIFLSDFPIVNYGEGTFNILYNVELSTNWGKDFRETKYLGGHIQGDWNAGVHRDSTINSVIVRDDDQYSTYLFRRMAEYPGICHIRTLDGSNYYADIQMTESIPYDETPTTSYSFKITRVDSDGYDGIELSEWNKMISG